MNALKGSIYDALDKLEGLPNCDLLEHQAVRQVFWWEALEFPGEDPDDLRSQAYIHWLEAKPLKPGGIKFSRYLMTAIRHCVLKAWKYRHRKKRFLPTVELPTCRTTGRVIEPAGQHAGVYFSDEERALLQAIVWRGVSYEQRPEIMLVLDGLMDGKTASEIGVSSKRYSLASGKIQRILVRSAAVLRVSSRATASSFSWEDSTGSGRALRGVQ